MCCWASRNRIGSSMSLTEVQKESPSSWTSEVSTNGVKASFRWSCTPVLERRMCKDSGFLRLFNEGVLVLAVNTLWSTSFAVPMWLSYLVDVLLLQFEGSLDRDWSLTLNPSFIWDWWAGKAEPKSLGYGYLALFVRSRAKLQSLSFWPSGNNWVGYAPIGVLAVDLAQHSDHSASISSG